MGTTPINARLPDDVHFELLKKSKKQGWNYTETLVYEIKKGLAQDGRLPQKKKIDFDYFMKFKAKIEELKKERYMNYTITNISEALFTQQWKILTLTGEIDESITTKAIKEAKTLFNLLPEKNQELLRSQLNSLETLGNVKEMEKVIRRIKAKEIAEHNKRIKLKYGVEIERTDKDN